jgi:LuxR family maltose regulon positive regulatory protein
MPALGLRFRVPQPRRQLVARTRLTDQLHSFFAFTPRLILVAAPAGFGKTTLLTQWLATLRTSERPPLVAWVAVDAADSDVRRLLDDLAASVEHAVGGSSGVVRALLDGARPVEDVLAAIVGELDEIAAPVIIAFDDFHLADSPEVHEAVTFLLDNLPPRVTLALATRADPPLSLARLRARGELVEVRAADLRFSAEEAAAFLGNVMGLSLDVGQVEALEARTEGWAVGLQLAALSARARAEESRRDR